MISIFTGTIRGVIMSEYWRRTFLTIGNWFFTGFAFRGTIAYFVLFFLHIKLYYLGRKRPLAKWGFRLGVVTWKTGILIFTGTANTGALETFLNIIFWFIIALLTWTISHISCGFRITLKANIGFLIALCTF